MRADAEQLGKLEEAHVKALVDEVCTDERFGRVEAAPKFNKQLWENRGEGEEADVQYEMSDERLHNDRSPNLGVVSEQPIHRVMILLKAQGLSNVEIGQRLGKTGPWVSQVLRQPWARQRLLDEINGQGRPVIQSILAGAAVDSVMTLIEMRDNVAAKPSERINASNSLLDRFLGKPTQVVEQHTTVEPTQKDVEALDREISRLEQEEKMLKGN